MVPIRGALLGLMLVCSNLAALAFEELGPASLSPMLRPEPFPIPSGTKIHWLRTGWGGEVGRGYVFFYESVDSQELRIRDSDGCGWTLRTAAFAPPLKWYDCRQERSGTQDITGSMGSPWPMTRETEFQYDFAGRWDDGFGA